MHKKGKRYLVFSRWSLVAGTVPCEKDREWNVVATQRREAGYEGQPRSLWGYPTRREAEKVATRYAETWVPGMMETKVMEVDWPADIEPPQPKFSTL